MSDQNNPWDKISKGPSKGAPGKKKFKKSRYKSDGGKPGDRKFDKPRKAAPAPKLKIGQRAVSTDTDKPDTNKTLKKGLILKDGKIVDTTAASSEARYEIAPLTNPADEKVPVKSKPNISGGLIPTAAPDFRSGFVSIVGRPNVGKSTLMNYLVGQKIAITSPVAQTTRNRLQGILTTPQAQIIFVDTPGIHKPHHELGKVLVQNARVAINSVDVVLFVVEATSAAGKGDLFVSNLVAQTKCPVVLGINKVDQLLESGRKAAEIKHSYEALAAEHGWSVVKFSALTGEGVENLQSELITKLESGPYYYPPDLVTDQPERFIMGELIREQILLHTREEVPHSVAIAIEKVEEDENITRILATVNVERKSQKGILIGKGGLMMKAISTAAREQMQKLVAGKVYLEIFVRVQERWRQSRTRLSEFGYRVEK
ncbi:GTPase Era [cf. Phormidesmis sp. LEGE 11477]|uniref:GTPase Era n=1 Tax=cf. Phormidesmis sp. LEGE 11477 TaxID=1828680 RepID=UPI00187E8FD2|nr:GTPase Era [cf. Phormidesmis sp. LEGE 11477]